MGGLTIALNNRINSSFHKKFESDNILVAEMTQLKVTVIASYFPPDTCDEIICSSLAEILTKKQFLLENVVVAGDFNCRPDNNDTRGLNLVDAMTNLHYSCLKPSCVCQLCHHLISESQHLDLCTSLDHLGTTRGKLFNVYYETVKRSKLSLY